MERDHAITRKEFLFFSAPEKALFYVLIFLALGYMALQTWQRVRLWQTGRPISQTRPGWRYWVPTADAARRWVQNIVSYVLLQRKVRSSRPRSGAPMHLLIFYGFLSLTLATTLLAIATYSPVNFHHGTYYLWYELTFDILGILLIVGLVWAIGRRFLMRRNPRTPLSGGPADMAVLWLLLVIGVNGYWLEASRMSANPQWFDVWSPIGHAWARAQGAFTPDQYRMVWWFHVALVVTFFAILPKLRLRHIVIAVFTAAGKPDVPMGQLRTIPMEEVEQTEQVGVKLARDFSRWHLMSLDACMECGRCTEVCPAWGVGKGLNPKQIVQDARAAMASGAELAPSLTEEALWQCTTCNACVEACPVLIRHVDLIVDVRRNLVSEGALAGSAATMLRQTASTGNAWGAAVSEREKWMEGLDIPLCRDGVEFEYLFWVGCAGATDPGAIRTTRAVADLLRKAHVPFACLGREEACTADPARRVGEEFLFQDKAAQNAVVFAKYGVKKVVTACPHCFNSLRNEYGDFGAELEVYHHSQLLGQLVRKGDLLAARRPDTVFHDPCYLARVNEETDAPREAVTEMQSPERSGRKTLCCGAGGGRMWMDEAPDQRPANRRADELLATGAKSVALGCPFCRIMLEPALRSQGGDEIRLLDLAEMLQEANP